ncbi:hypothetical protein BJ508DRAFT_366856 [Ascobolus immersus RN42]|uniref:Uncharacterized protein n=1 Tax=Ascobolus immersus RN42 TaxID=1160509 RepID=A0A3N4HGG4_ASCIM|nr:hypothetical protein BJ508DRAFT_366856 [Ascobolus immersus RN42]
MINGSAELQRGNQSSFAPSSAFDMATITKDRDDYTRLIAEFENGLRSKFKDSPAVYAFKSFLANTEPWFALKLCQETHCMAIFQQMDLYLLDPEYSGFPFLELVEEVLLFFATCFGPAGWSFISSRIRDLGAAITASMRTSVYTVLAESWFCIAIFSFVRSPPTSGMSMRSGEYIFLRWKKGLLRRGQVELIAAEMRSFMSELRSLTQTLDRNNHLWTAAEKNQYFQQIQNRCKWTAQSMKNGSSRTPRLLLIFSDNHLKRRSCRIDRKSGRPTSLPSYSTGLLCTQCYHNGSTCSSLEDPAIGSRGRIRLLWDGGFHFYRAFVGGRPDLQMFLDDFKAFTLSQRMWKP